MHKMLAGLVALLLVLVACSTSREEPAPSSTEPTTPTSTIAPLPEPGGGLPANVIVGCGRSGPEFPLAALDSTEALDQAAYEFVAAAMAPFLESEEGVFWPQEGWRILHEAEAEVLVVHMADAPDGPAVSFMEVELRNGAWRWAGSQAGGPCELTTTHPPGLNAVEWRLDPAFEVGPNSADIPLLATEVECVSGQPMGNRLLTPQILETADTVYITLAAIPPEGDSQTCPGNPERSLVVSLTDPLADRDLKDGTQIAGFLADYIGADFGLDP